MELRKGVDFTWGWWSRPRHEGTSLELVWVPRLSTAYDTLLFRPYTRASFFLSPSSSSRTRTLLLPWSVAFSVHRVHVPCPRPAFSHCCRWTCIALNIIVKVLPHEGITVWAIYVIVNGRRAAWSARSAC